MILYTKNYIDKATCNKLTDWALSAVKEGQFRYGCDKDKLTSEIIRSKFRLSNRIQYDKIQYPEEVYKIKEKILLDFPDLKQYPTMDSWGKDGVVTSITYEGGDVFPHKDPPVYQGFDGLRFNILSSKQERGGLLRIEDQTYDPEVGDLMAYKVTKLTHSVEKCYGKTPRVLFMFGWCVPETNDKYYF